MAQCCRGLEKISFKFTFVKTLIFMVSSDIVCKAITAFMWLQAPIVYKYWFYKYSERCLCFLGPFWICTTLVFAIAISGNLSTFLRHFGDSNYKYTPEFRKGKFSLTVNTHVIETFRLSLEFATYVFSSEHSCHSHLQLCLACAPWTLGFAAVEEQ